MDNHTKGIELEKHCMNLLQQLGFTSLKQTSRSGDQGADIVGTFENTRYVFQCKDHRQKQGNWSIQEVIGSKSIYKASHAGVISRTGFTQSAIALAGANYCLTLISSDLEAAIARGDSFASLISAYKLPPTVPIQHDDVVKKYEEAKLRVGHVPRRGDFDPQTLRYIERKYGGLKKLIAALYEKPFTRRPDNKLIVEEYKRVRQIIGRTPTLDDMETHSEFSRSCFKHFPFTKLQRECGDRPHRELGIDKSKLIEAYDALQKEIGHPPSTKEVDQKGKYRSTSYMRLWGTWEAFAREKGIPYFKGTRPDLTREEFVVAYLLVEKLLEIRGQGIAPDTWAIRQDLLFKGKPVIKRKTMEHLFKQIDHFKQAFASDSAQNLKRAIDDCLKSNMDAFGHKKSDA